MSLGRRVRRVLAPLLPGWPDAGRRIVQEPHLRTLFHQISTPIPPRRVLNAGTGEGLFSPLLLETAGNPLVLEVDLSFLFKRRARSNRQVFASASLAALPISSSTIDLVLCTEVLEHIPDDHMALDEFQRVLRPGAWLLLSVPTPPAVFDPNHVREGYTLAQLQMLLEERNFTVLGSRYSTHWFFRLVLRLWRPGRMPRLLIVALAWLDRTIHVGPPMNLYVLAQLGRG